MRQLIVHAISRIEGLEVIEAGDGLEALKKIRAASFDILLTDINMPLLDGLKLISMVRKDDDHRDIPIVVITTEGAQEDRDRAMSLGATAYLTKPIVSSAVIEKVRDLLGTH